MTNPVDLIFTNANIITMDPARPRAEALAVTDGVITALGSASEVAADAGPATRVVNLEGGTLSPGFVEAHGHVLLMAALLAPEILDVRSFTCPTWEDVSAAIDARISQTPPGIAVMVYGFDHFVHDRPAPTAADLDEFTTDHPLFIISFTAHNASANHAAMALAGLTADTPDPVGGTFGRHPDGSPNGTANEAPAVGALVLPIMLSSGLDLPASMIEQAKVMSAAGYTTVGELLVQPQDEPVLESVKNNPQNPIRFRLYEGTDATLTARGKRDDSNPMFRQVGVKLWVDGTPLEGSSFLNEPMLDTQVTRNLGLPPNCCGTANYSEEQLLETVRAYAASDFQMACHVQGDAGVDRILDVYETVLTERGMLGTDHRWRLEHCGGMTAAQFQRAADIGVTCSMFPAHMYYWGDVITAAILGEDRGSHWMRIRSALNSGMKVSLHNDGYLTPPDPIGNMEQAITRISRSGATLGADEAITIDEAMRAMTIDAAWHLHSEHEVGSIEVGKFADFVQLSADPYTVAPDSLLADVKVVGTWLAGERVS